jgi:hypothetical protein
MTIKLSKNRPIEVGYYLAQMGPDSYYPEIVEIRLTDRGCCAFFRGCDFQDSLLRDCPPFLYWSEKIDFKYK